MEAFRVTSSASYTRACLILPASNGKATDSPISNNRWSRLAALAGTDLSGWSDDSDDESHCQSPMS